jgi:hypothetical protein
MTANEKAKLELFRKVTVNGLPLHESRFGTFTGVLPLNIPDGTRIICYSDNQRRHKGVLEAVFRFADWWQPHLAIHMGDFMENALLSLHSPNAFAPPSESAQGEVESAAEDMRGVMTRGNPLHTFAIQGNHDNARATNYVSKLAPILAFLLGSDRNPLLSVASRMGFDPNDPITWITGVGQKGGAEGGLLINGGLRLVHGKRVRARPGESAWAHCVQNYFSTLIAHTHRLAYFGLQIPGGEFVEGGEAGCTIDWNRPEYNYNTDHIWHHGFFTITVHNGIAYIQPIPIIEGPDENGQLHKWFVFADDAGELHVFKCFDS